MFLNNRHYDPTVGVFTSVDPLVTLTGEPYIYGAANPIRFSDPSGLGPDTSARDRERAEASGGCTASSNSGAGCPKFSRRTSTKKFNAMTHDDRVEYAEWAAGYYRTCSAMIDRCWELARGADPDPLVRLAIRGALDQLRLEELLGLRTRSYSSEHGFFYTTPDQVSLDGLLLDGALAKAMGAAGAAGMGGCPAADCSTLHASARDSASNTAMLRNELRIPSGSGQLHHIVAQDVGNIIKFGLVAIHSDSNVILLSSADHSAVHRNTSRMYDPANGITVGQALTAYTFGTQAVNGQLLLQELGLM